MRQMIVILGLLAGLAGGTAVLSAHHGNAAFDTGKKLVLDGTVVEWIWSNPHCFLKFESKDASGEVRRWTVETSNPPDMVNRGWARNSFKAGDHIVATVEPVKSGNPVGRLLQVTLPSGKVLVAAGGGGGSTEGRGGQQ